MFSNYDGSMHSESCCIVGAQSLEEMMYTYKAK